MICRICGYDINEKGQDNISPISGYPVCEDCRDDICCDKCCSGGELYYVEEWNEILCQDCLIAKAIKECWVNEIKHYYTDDYIELCSDADLYPVIEYIRQYSEITEFRW